MVLFFLIPLGVLAQKYTGKRAEWFVHDRFGMFIHWGLYSGAEGYWKGEKLRYGNDYAEWIQYRNRIAKEEYLKLTDRFDWDKINPEELAQNIAAYAASIYLLADTDVDLKGAK